MDSPSRRRLIATAGTLLLVVACARSEPWPPSETGIFALHSAAPHVAARMTAHAGNPTTLEIAQYTPDRSQIITRYAPDFTRDMHLIVVRDDFATFAHLHPQLDRSTGHFSLPVRLDPGHRYYAYTDSAPAGIGQQVFRFVLQSGAPPHTLRTPVQASSPSAAAGPYTVTLATTTLKSGAEAPVAVTISRGGALASGILPYLGAAAHAVFINTQDLSYVHVHPMPPGAHHMSTSGGMMNASEPAATTAGTRLVLEVPALPRGAYKLWLQFRDKSAVWVAPFTIVAR
jgi:hypothetical protein